jgi:8-oxo-dGTP pyrophosphatase MutT (NUDIX family)
LDSAWHTQDLLRNYLRIHVIEWRIGGKMEKNKKMHHVSVTGIIIKNGKFLIVKRNDKEKAYPGRWTVPGGKIEIKDYKEELKDKEGQWYNIFENVVKREILEEVGLVVKNISYLTNLAFMRPDGIPTVVISLYCDYDYGEIRLNEELSEYVWVDLEEAKNYDLIEGIYSELEILSKILSKQ